MYFHYRFEIVHRNAEYTFAKRLQITNSVDLLSMSIFRVILIATFVDFSNGDLRDDIQSNTQFTCN